MGYVDVNNKSSSDATLKGDTKSNYSGGDSGGNRGFINNFAGGGSNASAPDINGSAFPGGKYWWAYLLGAVLLFLLWRRFKR